MRILQVQTHTLEVKLLFVERTIISLISLISDARPFNDRPLPMFSRAETAGYIAGYIASRYFFPLCRCIGTTDYAICYQTAVTKRLLRLLALFAQTQAAENDVCNKAAAGWTYTEKEKQTGRKREKEPK